MRICFVCLNAYPLLAAECAVGIIGGAELQQVQLARLFQREGHDVSFVTLDYGQEEPSSVSGFIIHKTYRVEAGMKGLRYIYPRLFTLWRAFTRARADIYYSRAAGLIPGLLAMYCRLTGAKYIYAAAHDTDFIPGRQLVRYRRDRFLFEYGLRHANTVIVQSETQRTLLKTHYRIDGAVIPNFSGKPARTGDLAERKHVLWVGQIRRLKRPIMYVELAKALPEVSFLMIGGRDPNYPELYQEVESAASKVSNLSFLGFQSLEVTERIFDSCKVFVSTSNSEGFPNTFLQAMRRGIPIVSFVDPDNVIATNNLGRIVQDQSHLRDVVSEMLANDMWPAAPIQQYFCEHFTEEAVAGKYRSLFERLLT